MSQAGIQMHSVLSVNVSGQEHIYKLEGSRYEIGRAIRSAIRINHPEVSRLQAVILRDPSGRYQLWDGDGVGTPSSNGTFVNGTRIQNRYLQSGDEIRFGSSAVSARYFTSLPPRTLRNSRDDMPDVDQEASQVTSATQIQFVED